MQYAPGTHPWSKYLIVRGKLERDDPLGQSDLDPAPHKFNGARLIRSPHPLRETSIRETVTLANVIAFREETDRLRQEWEENKENRKKDSPEKEKKRGKDTSLVLYLSRLSLQKKQRRVIYRYMDIFKFNGTAAVLEAIHFEIFLPDRPDLRFIALPKEKLDEMTELAEGDLFEASLSIFEVQYTPGSFEKHSERGFWMNYTAKEFNRLPRRTSSFQDYVYIAGQDTDREYSRAVCNWTSDFIKPPQRRFAKTDTQEAMESNRIYDAVLVDTSSAWMYPVEPPIDIDHYVKLVEGTRSTSHYSGTYAQEVFPLSDDQQRRIDDRLGEFEEFAKEPEAAEQHMISLFKLGVRFRYLITPPTKDSVFIVSIDPPVLQSYTEVFHLDSVLLNFEERVVKLTVEEIRREDQNNNNEKRKNVAFIHCKPSNDFVKVMEANATDRWVEATFHGKSGGPVEKIVNIIESENSQMTARKLTGKEVPSVLHAIYGNRKPANVISNVAVPYHAQKRDGNVLTLNEQQSKAMRMYLNIQNSAFCILSPPGSGKTTVAAAMAASLMKEKANRNGSVQLLLAVQNVAVENIALSLKTFDMGPMIPYRLLSKDRTEGDHRASFDIFEYLDRDYARLMPQASNDEHLSMKNYFTFDNLCSEFAKLGANPKDEEGLYGAYKDSLHAAKVTMEAHLRPNVILSTVDLLLYKLAKTDDKDQRGVRDQLHYVDRVIIDEASLLTESTFYCLVRCFPKASFVLIGDDKQLTPFLYNEKVLGQELAGRSALNVAMKRGNLPVIKLSEVYRAPQNLVQPYNKLSYNGELVSNKNDPCRPLLSAQLVCKNMPDLVLVDIPKGNEQGSPSPYNDIEIDAVIRLLALFPRQMHHAIMIICVYSGQKKRLQRRLGPDYEVITVDSSQGKEKPIVIVLTTRTDTTTEFFLNQNRCTVAVSRHQQGLILLGNKELLTSHHPWDKVLDNFTTIEQHKIPRPGQVLQISTSIRMQPPPTVPNPLSPTQFPPLNGISPPRQTLPPTVNLYYPFSTIPSPSLMRSIPPPNTLPMNTAHLIPNTPMIPNPYYVPPMSLPNYVNQRGARSSYPIPACARPNYPLPAWY